MKAMTCRHLGGPCDLALHGNTADEVIRQDKHLRENGLRGVMRRGDLHAAGGAVGVKIARSPTGR